MQVMQILGSFGMNGAQGLAFSCVAPFKEKTTEVSDLPQKQAQDSTQP